MCLAAIPFGITPIVRVCADALDEATRALDNGAMGIVFPHVDTAAQAKALADAFRYPPAGHRSWGGPPAIYGYQAPNVAEAQAAINAEILIVAMLESEEAIANADAIAAVDGIDVVHIGSFDLTSEMGIAGQMGHPRLIAAYETLAAACRKHGKVMGVGGINDEVDLRRYVAMGGRFLGSPRCPSSDSISALSSRCKCRA